MEEKRFRAWDGSRMINDGDDMGMYGALVTQSSVWYYDETNDVFHWRELDMPDGSVYMMYTDLKDKNGKDRCEGDIIRRNTGYVFEEKVYAFSIGISTCYGYGYHHEDEIIGNIYENPELLK